LKCGLPPASGTVGKLPQTPRFRHDGVNFRLDWPGLFRPHAWRETISDL
jgi:hypothetical protein